MIAKNNRREVKANEHISNFVPFVRVNCNCTDVGEACYHHIQIVEIQFTPDDFGVKPLARPRATVLSDPFPCRVGH